jgi:chaperonin cofactor prefoldin
MSPLAELNERIESLIKQKAGIESEIEDLRAQLTKMIDMLAGRIAE